MQVRDHTRPTSYIFSTSNTQPSTPVFTGIVDGGNLDWTEMSVWRRVMEVNFFAVVGVTRVMLPLLKRTPESR
jgi:hypothetical protein